MVQISKTMVQLSKLEKYTRFVSQEKNFFLRLKRENEITRCHAQLGDWSRRHTTGASSRVPAAAPHSLPGRVPLRSAGLSKQWPAVIPGGASPAVHLAAHGSRRPASRAQVTRKPCPAARFQIAPACGRRDANQQRHLSS